MLEKIKLRCGIAAGITVYDEEIRSYIADCMEELLLSGVPPALAESSSAGILTAVTLYVKAYLGNDRSDTNRYLDLYRKKVFRLTLMDQELCMTENSRKTSGSGSGSEAGGDTNVE